MVPALVADGGSRLRFWLELGRAGTLAALAVTRKGLRPPAVADAPRLLGVLDSMLADYLLLECLACRVERL